MLILPKLACGLAAREWSRYLRDSKPNRVSPLPGGLHWADIRPHGFSIAIWDDFGETLRNSTRGTARTPSMCDYSLEHLASRPARIGDKLVTTSFKYSLTGGFCAVGEPNVAVCLRPGTELAFDGEIRSPNQILATFEKARRKGGAVPSSECGLPSDASRRAGAAGWRDHPCDPVVRRADRHCDPIASGTCSRGACLRSRA